MEFEDFVQADNDKEENIQNQPSTNLEFPSSIIYPNPNPIYKVSSDENDFGDFVGNENDIVVMEPKQEIKVNYDALFEFNENTEVFQEQGEVIVEKEKGKEEVKNEIDNNDLLDIEESNEEYIPKNNEELKHGIFNQPEISYNNEVLPDTEEKNESNLNPNEKMENSLDEGFDDFVEAKVEISKPINQNNTPSIVLKKPATITLKIGKPQNIPDINEVKEVINTEFDLLDLDLEPIETVKKGQFSLIPEENPQEILIENISLPNLAEETKAEHNLIDLFSSNIEHQLPSETNNAKEQFEMKKESFEDFGDFAQSQEIIGTGNLSITARLNPFYYSPNSYDTFLVGIDELIDHFKFDSLQKLLFHEYYAIVEIEKTSKNKIIDYSSKQSNVPGSLYYQEILHEMIESQNGKVVFSNQILKFKSEFSADNLIKHKELFISLTILAMKLKILDNEKVLAFKLLVENSLKELESNLNKLQKLPISIKDIVYDSMKFKYYINGLFSFITGILKLSLLFYEIQDVYEAFEIEAGCQRLISKIKEIIRKESKLFNLNSDPVLLSKVVSLFNDDDIKKKYYNEELEDIIDFYENIKDSKAISIKCLICRNSPNCRKEHCEISKCTKWLTKL